jgi:hypothetical protein
MPWDGRWRSGKNFTLDDRPIRAVHSLLHPCAGRDEPASVVVLLGCSGAAVDDAHRQWRHSRVEPGQLGQKLSVLPSHRRLPCLLRMVGLWVSSQ